MPPIRSRSLRAAALASALAVGGAGAAGLAAVPGASAASGRTVTVITCSGHLVSRPSSYVLACGDGDTSLTKLRWSHWGAARATATGTELINLCTPNCAVGRTARVHVTVDAQRVRGGRYTRLVVHAGSRRPKGVPATETWTPTKVS